MNKTIILIHNASRPRRPHLCIRVLVCPWEAFSKQGEYELGSIGIWPQLIIVGPKCYQNGTRIQPKYHANHTLGHPCAGSERQVAKRRRVGSKWGHMGPKTGSQIVVFGIRFCQFLAIFSHSILEVIYNIFSRIVMI